MQSAVLHQMEAWAGTTKPPAIIATKRSSNELRKRVHALLGANEPEKLIQLRRLSEKAANRDDLPQSAAFIHMIFGGPAPPKKRESGHRDRGRPKGSTKQEEPEQPSSAPRRKSAPSKDRAAAKAEREGAGLVNMEVAVKSISRSGRSVKTPNKFKQQIGSPTNKRLFLQQTSPRSGGSSVPRKPRPGTAAARHVGSLGEEDGGAPMEQDTEVRVGEEFQIEVPAHPQPELCEERGDELVWSASAASGGPSSSSGSYNLSNAAIDAYLKEALPLVGGPSENPPTQSAAMESFPMELALMALHRVGGDPKAALDALKAGEGVISSDKLWTKVEERQFRASFAKNKGNIFLIHEAVKTKSFFEVVRYFFVEDGLRIKAERDRKREIELLRLSRSTGPKVNAGGSSITPSRASTPFDGLTPAGQSGGDSEEEGEDAEEQFVPQ